MRSIRLVLNSIPSNVFIVHFNWQHHCSFFQNCSKKRCVFSSAFTYAFNNLSVTISSNIYVDLDYIEGIVDAMTLVLVAVGEHDVLIVLENVEAVETIASSSKFHQFCQQYRYLTI